MTNRSHGKDRLFVPLSAEPYEWFKNSHKSWELRHERGAFQERHLKLGREVELRRGYSDRSSSLWGEILTVQTASSIREFFSHVPYTQVIPTAKSLAQALKVSAQILDVDPDEPTPLIGFEVNLPYTSPDEETENPVLPMSSAYLDSILEGTKTSTIRRSTDRYRPGSVLIVSGDSTIKAEIVSVNHISGNQIDDSLARADGFENSSQLQDALRNHYPQCDIDNEAWTLIRFRVPAASRAR